MTEEQAIKSCLQGNAQAFGFLYDLYIQKVYRFVYYRTHHKQTAEDLTSLIFTKAFAKMESFNPKFKFSTWIFSIARNTVIDHYRGDKPTTELEDALQVSDSTNLSKEFELQEKMEAVKKYLDTLPPEQKDLVIMRLWDDLSYTEIAAILGRNESALRVSFSRIISKMQKELVLSLILLALIYK